MEPENVSLSAALIAGLLSFFSPCVLPLVPVYLGYITGMMVGQMQTASRLPIWLHALFFVLGFGLVFVVLGATAGLLGSLLYPLLPYIVRLGGLLLIVFGLQMTGLITIPWLSIERRFELNSGRPRSYWTSLLVGIVFAAGWTPCVGPVLTAILLLAADSQTISTGALLLTAYALGLGLPFLAVAALVDVALPVVRRLTSHLRIISIVSGVLLALMGLLLLTGLFQRIVFWLNSTFLPLA